MVSLTEVANAFVAEKPKKCRQMFTDGKVVYSWGEHWPLSVKVITTEAKQIYFINVEKYSSSTANHLRHVIGAISSHSNLMIEVHTAEIKEIIRNIENNNYESTYLTRKAEHKNVDVCLNNLKTIMKEKGMKRFPAAKIKELLVAHTLCQQ